MYTRLVEIVTLAAVPSWSLDPVYCRIPARSRHLRSVLARSRILSDFESWQKLNTHICAILFSSIILSEKNLIRVYWTTRSFYSRISIIKAFRVLVLHPHPHELHIPSYQPARLTTPSWPPPPPTAAPPQVASRYLPIPSFHHASEGTGEYFAVIQYFIIFSPFRINSEFFLSSFA